MTDSNANAVYDYSASQYFNFSGQAATNHVNVYDYGRSCYLTGSPNSLYDYGRGAYIQLKPESSGSFSGYDYGSSRYFSGKVSGRAISLYDYETGSYYRFQI